MEGRSPAQVYALVIGAVLTVAGILGFFYEPSFAAGSDDIKRSAVLGILDVNGWHNLVHILSGVAGLALARSYASARTYAIGLAVVYTVVAVWGFIIGDGDAILQLIPVNTEDNFLHALIAVAGYAAYAASPAEPAPSTVGTATA
jgi:Domain of unknown function (DUF4383)